MKKLIATIFAILFNSSVYASDSVSILLYKNNELIQSAKVFLLEGKTAPFVISEKASYKSESGPREFTGGLFFSLRKVSNIEYWVSFDYKELEKFLLVDEFQVPLVKGHSFSKIFKFNDGVFIYRFDMEEIEYVFQIKLH